MIARSLTFRAVLALSLLLGFYALGLAVGLGLVGGAVLLVTESSRIPVKLVLIMVVAGGTVLWSLVPRFSRWEAPGPRVTEGEQPRLFALIRQVAQAMGQPVPAEVYLVPEVNAFVAHVGGFLGLGGRRVMGVGLGLLAVDNVSQVKATLAHEFGHFAGGDTRLGGLIYATRGVMIRTLQNLASQGSLLVKPFEWVFNLYLRVTQAISRQQELLADEWSVRVAGKTAHLTGLRQESLHGASFGLFLQSEVQPLASVGVAPRNVFEGFRRFGESSTFRKLEPVLQASLGEARGDAFDSHPPLPERLAWAEALPWPDQPVDATPGTSLLDGAEALEAHFSAAMAGGALRPIEWAEAGPALAQSHERRAARVQARVEGMTVQRALDALRTPALRDAFVEAVDPHLIGWTLPDRAAQVQENLTAALDAYLGAHLARLGFTWHTAPGEPLSLRRGEAALELRPTLLAILEGRGDAGALEAFLDRAGLARGASLPVADDVRRAVLEPNAAVEVLARGKKVTLRAPLASLLLPRCCGVCQAPAVDVVPTRFAVGKLFKSQEQLVEIPVPTCEAHRKKTGTALDAREWKEATGLLTFTVKAPGYAELLQRVNG